MENIWTAMRQNTYLHNSMDTYLQTPLELRLKREERGEKPQNEHELESKAKEWQISDRNSLVIILYECTAPKAQHSE